MCGFLSANSQITVQSPCASECSAKRDVHPFILSVIRVIVTDIGVPLAQNREDIIPAGVSV